MVDKTYASMVKRGRLSEQDKAKRMALIRGTLDYRDAAGADVFITGEISEPQAHYARETGVAYVAAGHHATERYGVQALGQHLASRFGLTVSFIDIDNPA